VRSTSAAGACAPRELTQSRSTARRRERTGNRAPCDDWPPYHTLRSTHPLRELPTRASPLTGRQGQVVPATTWSCWASGVVTSPPTELLPAGDVVLSLSVASRYDACRAECRLRAARGRRGSVRSRRTLPGSCARRTPHHNARCAPDITEEQQTPSWCRDTTPLP
jgi:hypothetical protein